MCLFAASKHLLDAGAFVCKLTSGGAQGLGRLRIICIGEKANSMSCVGMLQLPLTFTPRTESASGAGSEAIGPLSNPTGDRYRRLAELMTPDDLDTADPPDTPYQSSVAEAAETRLPPDIAIRPFPCFVRQQRRARRLPRNGQACASLIGRCTSSPTSLTRVVGCVADPHASFHLRTVLDVQCVVAK